MTRGNSLLYLFAANWKVSAGKQLRTRGGGGEEGLFPFSSHHPACSVSSAEVKASEVKQYYL